MAEMPRVRIKRSGVLSSSSLRLSESNDLSKGGSGKKFKKCHGK